ncbi:MAG TPA: phosphoenolpyruvate--protein phosphotransferase [Candidatus Limnocylindria bacterium]
MTTELRGVPAASGAAIGAPWIHQPAGPQRSARTTVPAAAAAAAAELEALAERLRAEGQAAEAEIFDAQALMAADPELLDAATSAVDAGADPVAAIGDTGETVAATFEALDDEVLSARAADVRDVCARIARHLVGAAAPRLHQRSIVVAVDLPPSVTVELDRALLAGIALEGGSRTSHAAILARGLGIPAVVGVPDLVRIATGAGELAIDGDAGRLVVEPDDGVRADIAGRAAADGDRRAADASFAALPLATSDGHRVLCAANIGEPGEALGAFAAGAEGIGLFRTEFAFAGRSTAPNEQDQADAYATVLESAGGAPVVVRLADIGGDKPLPYLPIPTEANPFLGVRAIRLAASHPDLFPTQVRAILAASARTGRQASIMAPMVADADDVALVRGLVRDALAAVPDAPAPRVGIMVEVPSAVLLADALAREVDFMSIGTNDLTAYLLAADRTNAALAARQDPCHPAVLRAVARVVEAAAAAGDCEVAVCGEMAGDPVGALLLVGLGVDELSMEPSAFGAVKRAVASRTIDELRTLGTAAQVASSADAVRALVAA